jgi:hypothetical protein
LTKKRFTRKNKGSASRHNAARRPRSKVKRFFGRNVIALLAILFSAATTFFVYYLAYSEPDIRVFPVSQSRASQPIKDKNGSCTYQYAFLTPFKNLSLKGGYIGNATFISMSETVVPEFNLIYIDKSKLEWRETRDIEIMYSIALTPDACRVLVDHDEHLMVGIDFYDNTGKSINKDVNGGPITLTTEVTFKGQTPAQP